MNKILDEFVWGFFAALGALCAYTLFEWVAFHQWLVFHVSLR